MDLLIFDISVVPGSKICPRCSAELSEITSDSKLCEVKSNDTQPPLSSDEREYDIQELDFTVTQVCYIILNYE